MTDFYRQRLNHFHWTWLEPKFCRAIMHPLRRKERMATKLARAYAKRQAARDSDYDPDEVSGNPCRVGSCPHCLGWRDCDDETPFERTKEYAAQRGAI